MRRSTLVLALAAMLLLVAAPAGAAPVDKQVAPVFELGEGVPPGEPTGEPVGTARLLRFDRGVMGHIKVDDDDLEPRDTFTVWAMVTEPGHTDPDDTDPDAPVTEIGFAGGGIVNGSGTLNVKVRLSVGPLEGFPGPAGDGLEDPRNAEIVFILRTHGPAVPGIVDQQTSTLMGGCNYDPEEFGDFGDPGPSPFDCVDLYGAAFPAPGT